MREGLRLIILFDLFKLNERMKDYGMEWKKKLK
jgi:hypothetical protein